MLHYRYFLKIYFLFTNSSVIYNVLFKLAVEFLTSISRYFNSRIFGGSNLPHAFLVTFYVLNFFFNVFIISRNIISPVPRSPFQSQLLSFPVTTTPLPKKIIVLIFVVILSFSSFFYHMSSSCIFKLGCKLNYNRILSLELWVNIVENMFF